MKSQRLKEFIPCRGINNVLMPMLGDADNIVNCRYVAEGGWKANVGFENWWKFPQNYVVNNDVATTYFEKKVDSVYQWKRQGSNDIYTFVECNGQLYYILGNKGQGTSYNGSQWLNDIVVVDSDRYVPKLGDIGSQYINLGQHLLIINGRDRAILFSGDRVWRDFGYVIQTPSCNPVDVDTGYTDNKMLKSGSAIYFEESSRYGLGGVDANTSYEYNYKMTLISNLGAESPMSAVQNVRWTLGSSALYKYGVAMDLPIGQEGTVARRIYRTKNINDNGEIYYFLTQIDENSSRFYIDVLPDRQLVDEAPSVTASTAINSDWKYGEVWDNRLWLAKGNQIIYSDKGIFEQFGLLNFFDLGNLSGGDVTQLRAFYNNLIVFRETAINIISFDAGFYNISTITNTIGTTATNTVILIPQLGVVFLNEQGVWMLTGGLNGGASIQIQKISNPIDKLLRRLNKPMLHKSVGAYSAKEKEVWIHFCTADLTTPDTGIVLHLEPKVPMWSVRTNIDDPLKSTWSAMTTTINGYFLLGVDPNWTIQSKASTVNFGILKVMTSSPTWGQGSGVSSLGEVTTLASYDISHCGHIWESAWYGYQDNSVKIRYFSVELRILSYGDNPFDFYYAVDYSYNQNSTLEQKQAKSETVFTLNEDAVFGPTDRQITKVPFKVGEDIISEGRLITLRYDVNTELCDQFKFGIKTIDKTEWHLLSFNLLSDAVAIPSLNQSTKVAR